MRTVRRILKITGIVLGVLVGLFGLIQLVPYGRRHTNPPVIQEPAWDSPRTRDLAVRACYDCHSNETRWPWYAHVAPMSWSMQRHVDVGRTVLNFSEWDRTWDLAQQASSSVIRRDMPPWTYKLVHGEARLTETEKIELARGLHATFGVPGEIR